MNNKELKQIKESQLEAEIATEDAAIEKEKAGFIEKEKALQQQQHAFNELNNSLSVKKKVKRILSVQRLQYLKEREAALKDFLSKSRRTVKRNRRKHCFYQTTDKR